MMGVDNLTLKASVISKDDLLMGLHTYTDKEYYVELTEEDWMNYDDDIEDEDFDEEIDLKFN